MYIKQFKDLHFNVKVRLFEQFASNIAGNMIFPFIIIYFSQVYGAAMTGVIFVINTVISFLVGLLGGHFADKYGRQKILAFSEIVRCLSLIIMAFSFLGNANLIVFISNILVNASTGFSRPAGDAMLVDASTEENRKFIYTADYMMFNGSLLIGGLVGGFLFATYKFELVMSLGIISLISLIMLLFFIRDTIEFSPSKNVQKNIFKELATNYKVVAKDSIFIIFVIACVLELSVQLQAMNYTGVRLVTDVNTMTINIFNYEFELNGYNMFGLLNFTNCLLVIILANSIARLSKRFKDKNVLIVGIILYSIGFGLISYLASPLLLILSMVIVVVGELAYVPIKQALLANMVPAESRGAYMAINGLTTKGASILGSLAITVGAFLPSIVMSFIFLMLGILSTFLFYKVFNYRVIK
ncbi:MFS transporter [Rummeliibacillus suwonensis]|uniref:MFS transporter n=1 Tax=Rummeliibacillus suwonensis TaxID=1306154 RepID=UPI0011B40971|nr:MFS transporter [Rummeliibacillus suwonensis]